MEWRIVISAFEINVHLPDIATLLHSNNAHLLLDAGQPPGSDVYLLGDISHPFSKYACRDTHSSHGHDNTFLFYLKVHIFLMSI